MDYKNKIVNKPWGYEYLVYENDDVALWLLYIGPDQSTSMHCHPKKTTGLVVLRGEAEISFLADKRSIKALDKIMIRRGLFHSTKSLSPHGTVLFEIETPKDKHDLVRLNDKYGRESQPYEGEQHEEDKSKYCLWIEEPILGSIDLYEHAGCNMIVETINDINVIINRHDEDLIMFLKGGMVKDINGIKHLVTIPGDVGFAKIVKEVAKQLDGVQENTIILIISKNI